MSAAPTTTRRLAAILMADVVGYAHLMEVDEAGTLAVLKHRRTTILEPIVRAHGGRIAKVMGDGVLIEFASAIGAVEAAREIQHRLAEANAGTDHEKQILVRIGINLGDVIGEGADIYGDGVNIAARLEALAEPGGIVVSAKVHEEVAGKVEAAFADLGEQQLKNLARPVRAYRISDTVSAKTASAIMPARPELISVAVLPFTNMSGDASQEYFVDGLTEDLITALSKFRLYSVLSRNSTFQFKGRAVDVQNVGRQLGARYVLEGSIRTGGNRLRINVQLIDAESGAHVWAEKFDRELADVFAVQDEIVAAIASQVFAVLVDTAVSSRINLDQNQLTSYDNFLRSRSAWARGNAQDTLKFALNSVDADPSFAAAVAFLAFFYAEDIWMQVTGLPISELERRAHECIPKALALNSADPDVHLLIGSGFLDLGELALAKQHLELALSLNPHLPHATMNLGLTLVFMGKSEQGLEMIERAFRLDPRHPTAMRAVPFIGHCTVGNIHEAERWFNGIQNPFAYLHLMMAGCLAQAGRDVDALAHLTAFNELKNSCFDTVGFISWVSKCLKLPEDRSRFLTGYQKLGLIS
jgi:TolB-like protein